MKKYLLIIFLLIICSGCFTNNSPDTSTDVSPKSISDSSLEDTLKDMGFEKKEFNCGFELSDILEMSYKNMDDSSYLLTLDNKLYEYDLDYKFSETNNNCRYIDTNNIKINKFSLGNLYPTDTNGNFYVDENFLSQIENISPEKKLKESYPSSTIQIYDNEHSIIADGDKAFKADKDGNQYEIYRDTNEKISKIYLAYLSEKKLFIETESYFEECSITEININNCEDYKDIKCPTTFKCETMPLSNFKSDIYYFNGETIITNNQEVFGFSK